MHIYKKNLSINSCKFNNNNNNNNNKDNITNHMQFFENK